MKNSDHDEQEPTPRDDAAHALNELLTVIAGYAELSRELLPHDGAVAIYQTEILRAAEAAASLVSTLSSRPRAAAIAPHAVPAPVVDGAAPHWHRRVLLVDDEPAVRKFTSAILALNGFDVVAVGSAPDAIAACEARDGCFGLVISDVVMSPVDGLELVTALAERWPALPALLISGFPGVAAQPLDRHGRHIPFLSKPYTNFQLLAKVRSILAALPRP